MTDSAGPTKSHVDAAVKDAAQAFPPEPPKPVEGCPEGAAKKAAEAKDKAFAEATEHIKIEGDEEFQNKVKGDLRKIYDTPTGGKLLQSLHDSGKTVTIKPGDPLSGNATGYSNGADRLAAADGTPGKGTDSFIEYNPDVWKIGDEEWEQRPPAIGLAHELIHAEHAAHGTMSPGMTNNDAKPNPADPGKIAQEKKREVEAVGIPPDDQRDFTENKIRQEWTPKQPERKWY